MHQAASQQGSSDRQGDGRGHLRSHQPVPPRRTQPPRAGRGRSHVPTGRVERTVGQDRQSSLHGEPQEHRCGHRAGTHRDRVGTRQEGAEEPDTPSDGHHGEPDAHHATHHSEEPRFREQVP